MRTFRIAALLVALTAAGTAIAQDRAKSAAGAWEIGPVIQGENYSVGTPPAPTRRRGGGLQIDIPPAPGSVHYVTFSHGSLENMSRIVMRYRVEMAPGAQIVPTRSPESPSIITLYFQRAGDNWSGRRRFETYRWYATFASQSPITPGEHQMVAPLAANWTAIERSSASSDPMAFRDAVREADRVGFVLGGGDGYGHGVSATGRARIIVTEFRVE